MKICFITTNKHKYKEVKEVLSEFGMEVEWLNEEYNEPEGDIDFIAKESAKVLAEKHKKPTVVDDTGIFFEAYNNFPGPNAKFVFHGIGYDGIMRLLEGKTRKAYFKTAVGYCEPGKDPVVFEGIMKGEITEKVFDEDRDVLPYMRVFIPEGKRVTNSQLSMEEKNAISHRAEAFRKLGKFLKNR